MTSTLSIANRRREILISMWVKDPFSVQTQVDTHDMALRVAHNISDEAEALTDTVGSHRPRSVFVLKAGSDPDRTWSVWVRAGFSNYKAAYLAFINEAYGVAMTGDDIPGYQVDHLSNKAYAPTGNEYIRVEAIPEAANHSWGVNFESARTRNTDGRSAHLMNFMSCAKLGGQLAPRGLDDTAGIQRLVDYFVRIGIPKPDAEHGVQSMLHHAYWNRNA